MINLTVIASFRWRQAAQILFPQQSMLYTLLLKSLLSMSGFRQMSHANGSSLVETMPRRSMPSPSLPPDDFKSSLAEAASGSMDPAPPLLAPRPPATTRADEREELPARPPLADLALPRRLCFFPILRIYCMPAISRSEHGAAVSFSKRHFQPKSNESTISKSSRTSHDVLIPKIQNMQVKAGR